MDDKTENVLNEVLNPEKRDKGILPSEEVSTAEVAACARMLRELVQQMKAPKLDGERRRSLGGQTRVYQGGATSIAMRILQRSERAAQEAELGPAAVENLLLFETAVSAVRRGAWPVALYALTRLRRSGEDVDDALKRIAAFAATAQGKRVAQALAHATGVAQRGAQSQRGKQRQQQRNRAEAAAQVDRQRKRVAGKRAAQHLAGDLGEKKAPRVPGTRGRSDDDDK